MECHRCGSLLPELAVYCSRCGVRLLASEGWSLRRLNQTFSEFCSSLWLMATWLWLLLVIVGIIAGIVAVISG